MATRESTPGDCPHCGHVVPAANVLIEYVRDDGRPAAYSAPKYGLLTDNYSE
jgi:hypothetical protein